MTDLEIMRNYTEGLPALGFRITNTDRNPDQTIVATASKDGAEYWVRVSPSNGNGLHIMVLQVAAFRSTIVPLAANDCPPVPGLRDFEATSPPDTRTYGDVDFRVVEGNEAHNVTKIGATCHQDYGLRHGIPNKTDLEIMKNYAEALPAAGFRITNTDRNDDQTIDATMTRDGVETWVTVSAGNGNVVSVVVVRVEPFRSTIVPLAANDCGPVPGLRDFEATSPPDTRTYRDVDFRVVEGNQARTVTRIGAYCHQRLRLAARDPQQDRPGDHEELRRGTAGGGVPDHQHRSQRRPEDRCDDDQGRGGDLGDRLRRQRQRRQRRRGAGGAIPLDDRAAGRQRLRPGAGAARLRGERCRRDSRNFDDDGLPGGRGQRGTQRHARPGKTCQQDYGLRQGVPNKTDLEIMKNYAEALPAAGFRITNTDRNDDQTIIATMTKDGVETWVQVSAGNGNGMHVAVLQIEPFHSTLKAPQVAAPAPPPRRRN